MDKKDPIKKIVRLSENDKRILNDYSSTITDTTHQTASKAAVDKTFIKLA